MNIVLKVFASNQRIFQGAQDDLLFEGLMLFEVM